ncbi:MAG: hypothetical protein NWF00_08875 [Candidatus Bathyarchaeota archaeon]|nr:hypothetical protein [Candidatus Bathyarchaeota archaeon]
MANRSFESTPPNKQTIKNLEVRKVLAKQPQRNRISLMVSVKVLGEAKPEELSKGTAYVFSKGGALLGKTALNSQGTARVDVNLPVVETVQSLRLIVGPDLKEDVTASALLRLGGEQSFVQVAPKVLRKEVVVQVIPKQVLCWLLSACIVQGKVMKKVASGGITMNLPVCGATIEIYEVDPVPILISKLPLDIIERIRDFLVYPPPPPPPPIRQRYEVTVGPVPPQPLILGDHATNQLAENVEKPVSRLALKKASCLDASIEDLSVASTLLAGEEMKKLRVLANTTNGEQFRQILISNAPVIKNILCLFPFVKAHMDLVATATTAECDKFKALFFRGCGNLDAPDLYFKVKQKIFVPFPPITIYAPTPVLCNTFWNYQCGTQDVTLYVTHPLARVCPPCPPVNAPQNWVLFMAIGNHPLSRIRGTGVSEAATTNSTNVGLTDGDAPFGETLRPRIEFDNSLREDLGVKYYQVSYRKGTSGPFTPITATINRHYTHEVGGDLVLEAYNLGPKSEKSPGVPLANTNLFEIPPALPPTGQWSIPNAVEDTANAKFKTVDLASLQDPGVIWPESGLYQLKIDLFDENGNLVNIDGLGICFRVPTSTDISGTVETEDATSTLLTNNGAFSPTGLVQDDDGDGKKSMIVALYIDNSRCKAEIPAPTLDGVAAGDDCGVMKYQVGPPPAEEPLGTVEMYYRPAHPAGVGSEGFATYMFSLTRGGNPSVTLSSGRTPLPATSMSTTRSVSDILGTCDTAGFVEHMHVYAMATSGWRRLYEYDAEVVRGFVLAPKPKAHGPPSP